MLANLLPGLREIRAPLAAGYLVLVTVWVLFNDQIDPGRGASETVDAIVRLKDQLGTAAFAAALSFVAYLLGALWEPAATWLEPRLWRLWLRAWGYWEPRELQVKLPRLRLRVWLLKRRKRDVWAALWDEAERASRPPSGVRVSKEGWQQLWGVAERLFADVDEKVRGRLHVAEEEDSFDALVRASQAAYGLSLRGLGLETFENPFFIDGATAEAEYIAATAKAGDNVHELLAAAEAGDLVENALLDQIDATSIDSARCQWWLRELPPLFEEVDHLPDELAVLEPLVVIKVEYESPTVLPHRSVADRILDELPLTARRLVTEEEKLFLEVDRLKGEISFRFVLALPLAITATVLAVGLSLPWYAGAGVAVAGWLAGVALMRDGWRRDKERNDLLISLLSIEKAKSPTFERLNARADALGQEDVLPGRGQLGSDDHESTRLDRMEEPRERDERGKEARELG